MFALIGIKDETVGGFYEEEHMIEVREIVAVFTNEERAREYVKRSTLKHPETSCSKFRQRSLLFGYRDVEIKGGLFEDPEI